MAKINSPPPPLILKPSDVSYIPSGTTRTACRCNFLKKPVLTKLHVVIYFQNPFKLVIFGSGDLLYSLLFREKFPSNRKH
jgi:hypothetical protein